MKGCSFDPVSEDRLGMRRSECDDEHDKKTNTKDSLGRTDASYVLYLPQTTNDKKRRNLTRVQQTGGKMETDYVIRNTSKA